MPRKAESVFHEQQSLRQMRVLLLLLIPPGILTLLVIWQVVLGHPFGKVPMSNARLIGWTVFLWLVYLRLITIRLVTDVRPEQVSIALRGLWRSRRIPTSDIQSAEVVTFDPARDYGGYGIRSTRHATAYLAGGHEGVRLALRHGLPVVLGSQRAQELANAITRQIS